MSLIGLSLKPVHCDKCGKVMRQIHHLVTALPSGKVLLTELHYCDPCEWAAGVAVTGNSFVPFSTASEGDPVQ